MTPEDRILHYALGRVLGRVEDTDLCERILRAWERGETAAAPAPALGPAPGDGSPGATGARPARTPAWLRWLPAAAAVLAAAGLGWWSSRPVARPPADVRTVAEAAPAGVPAGVLGRADAPLARFDEPGGGDLRALTAGERALVPAGRPVTLELSAGARLTAWPQAVFSLAAPPPGGAGPRVLLEAGTLSLALPAGAGGRAAVEAGFAVLHAEPGSLVLVHLEPDDPDAELSPAELARGLREGADLPRLLSVEVTAGSARLATAQGGRALSERGAAAVSSVPYEFSRAALERRWIDERLLLASRAEERFAGPGGAGGKDLAAGASERAEAELYEYLDARPTRWILLYEVARGALAAPPAWFGQSVLATLVAAPHPRAFATARALWRERPEAFSAEHVVALAERGGFEFERELRAHVDGWAPGDGLPVLAAAWFARRGDGRGLELLARAAELPLVGPEAAYARVQAALGLEALGRAGAVDSACAEIARGGLALLDAGRLDLAGRMAATLALVAEARAAGASIPLVGLRGLVDERSRADQGRFSEAAAVRALLADFLPD